MAGAGVIVSTDVAVFSSISLHVMTVRSIGPGVEQVAFLAPGLPRDHYV